MPLGKFVKHMLIFDLYPRVFLHSRLPPVTMYRVSLVMGVTKSERDVVIGRLI